VSLECTEGNDKLTKGIPDLFCEKKRMSGSLLLITFPLPPLSLQKEREIPLKV
jgi:hypothetical protein